MELSFPRFSGCAPSRPTVMYGRNTGGGTSRCCCRTRRAETRNAFAEATVPSFGTPIAQASDMGGTMGPPTTSRGHPQRKRTAGRTIDQAIVRHQQIPDENTQIAKQHQSAPPARLSGRGGGPE